MRGFIILVVLFSICSNLPFLVTDGEAAERERRETNRCEFFADHEVPVSHPPIWRSPQKGVAQRRPYTPKQETYLLFVMTPAFNFLQQKDGVAFFLSSAQIKTLRRYQAFQVYRF